MNNLSLSTGSLASLHEGLGQCLEGKQPLAGLSSAFNAGLEDTVNNNFDHVASELSM